MLQIRFHPKFKSAETLLFAGSRAEIERLHKFFVEWDGESVDLINHLQANENLCLFSVKELVVRRKGIKSALEWKDEKGTWFISSTDEQKYIDLLDGLLKSQTPGHQYLDYTGTGHVQIMVSKDEYPMLSTGEIVGKLSQSKEGISFSAGAVDVLRHHVMFFGGPEIVKGLGVGTNGHGYYWVIRCGDNAVPKGYLTDEVEGVQFYWHNLPGIIDQIRGKYIVDLQFEGKGCLIPLPAK